MIFGNPPFEICYDKDRNDYNRLYNYFRFGKNDKYWDSLQNKKKIKIDIDLIELINGMICEEECNRYGI